MNTSFSLDIPFFIIAIALFITFLLLRKKYDFGGTWMNLIKKWAPFWLSFFPAFITYFFVCGSVSALAFISYSAVVGKENFNRDNFLLIENIVEFTCSLIMPYIYFKILKKQGFHLFWMGIITVVHMLVAGYRDAKLIYLDPLTHDGNSVQSGPIILSQFEYLDAVFPLISFLVFYFFVYRKNDKESSDSLIINS